MDSIRSLKQSERKFSEFSVVALKGKVTVASNVHFVENKTHPYSHQSFLHFCFSSQIYSTNIKVGVHTGQALTCVNVTGLEGTNSDGDQAGPSLQHAPDRYFHRGAGPRLVLPFDSSTSAIAPIKIHPLRLTWQSLPPLCRAPLRDRHSSAT